MFTLKLFRNTLCEFGPILAFLIAFEVRNFRTGVIAMMVATFVALIILKKTEDHIPLFALFSSGTVLFFGGLSLLIDIPSIFILRDTLFDLFLGVTLLISVWVRRPLFKYLFPTVFGITDQGWSTLSYRWGIFFLLLAAINEWVRQMLSPEDWVLAKIFIIIASVCFGAYQFTLTRRERLPQANAWGILS